MEIYGMLGERLGPIGSTTRHDQSEAEKLPQWKKDFLQKPSISIRNGIAWSYNAPYEDTDTLVLTSTQSGFVDIRFPRKRELGKPFSSDPPFWAFGGMSSTTFLEGPEIIFPYSAHCVWNHEIDSKGPDISDEGDMYILPNGNAIEVGTMQNPQTGKVELYKEYWTTPKLSAASPLMPCIVARTVEPPNYDAQNNRTPPKQRGGLVIRIGSYCQGIVCQRSDEHDGRAADADTILVERWNKAGADAKDSSDNTAPDTTTPLSTSSRWTQDWRSNTPPDTGVVIPCMWLVDDSRQLGDETVVQGLTWRIVEAVFN